MKDRKKYILREAVVLLIALAMVLTTIPAINAAGDQNELMNVQNPFSLAVPLGTGISNKGSVLTHMGKIEMPDGSLGGGVSATNWLQYCDETMENGIGLTAGGECAFAIELTDAMLTGYRGWTADEAVVFFGSDVSPEGGLSYEVWVTDSLPPDPLALTPNAAGITSGADNRHQIPLTTTFTIPATGNVWLGSNIVHAAGQFPMGLDEDHTTPPEGGLVYLAPSWDNIQNYFPGVWGLELGVTEGGGPGPGPGECLDDQCDFEIVSINNIPGGKIPAIPQIVNITIRNNGEVGIPELKLLCDIYEKVCGPTSTLCCDNIYDLCTWDQPGKPGYAGDDWTWTDDGDGDTWVLQGGPDNRWLTNDQAWRCTAGEDRSYGGDEDVYLGLSPGSVGFDNLTWHCEDNDISAAACATFTFSHWCEGEYYIDDDGFLHPVDYGTIAYSLDDGATWTKVPQSEFVAYDTYDEWKDITLKFINTGLPNYDSYSAVCDDCEPGADDIAIYVDFPPVAKLQVRFIWHKNVCQQYEGWYVDKACLTRTENYDLILVHQTHEIIELPPCVDEPENIYYEFPLGWTPLPDTWYMICILGQVFDCPDCCEKIFDNNEMCLQFFVTDIHDMACVDIKLETEPFYKGFYLAGSPVTVNMTVQNMGTFAEDNVPVELKVGKQVVDKRVDTNFEDDVGDWDYYYFTTRDPDNRFRWTKGDASVSKIFEFNEAEARSVLPGEESFICAEIGLWPFLPPNAGSLIVPTDNILDLENEMAASLSFWAKWSLPDGVYGFLAVMPTEGDGSGWVGFEEFGASPLTYANDWVHVDLPDFKAAMRDACDARGWLIDGRIPKMEIGWVVFDIPNAGQIGNPSNPIPWTGFMIDNIELDIISCEDMIVVDTQYTGALAPGEKANIFLTWPSAEPCSWCVCGDINLEDDVDPTNDVCCVQGGVSVKDAYHITGFSSLDLTDRGGDCLWHICCTRQCDGTCCAWAGVVENNYGHYVNNMDDSLVSPVINLEAYNTLGVSLNITTWYNFNDPGDFGEVYVRNSSSEKWVYLGDVTGTSNGVFEEMSFYIKPEHCTSTVQVRFRMVSNDAGFAEGWYVCNVRLVEVLAVGPPSAGGFTADAWLKYHSGSLNNAIRWTDFTPWCCAIELDQAKLSGWSGYALTDVRFCVGDDVYGYSNADYQIFYATGTTPPDYSTLTPIAQGTAFGWTEVPVIQQTLPTSDSAFIILEYSNYDGYPAGMDDTNYDDRGDWVCYHATTNDWQHMGANLGYYYVWSIEAGISLGGDVPIEWGITIWSDDFDRTNIAPWICERSPAGDYWDTQTQCISGYPSKGQGLNDVMYTKLDFTDPELTYVELYFETSWNMEDGCHAYIEISPNWDGDPATYDTATWVKYWAMDGASDHDWINSHDLTGDDRFVLNEYLGMEVYLGFRYTTPGGGFDLHDGFWCIRDKEIIFKKVPIPPEVDDEPPVTTACFDGVNKVSFVAVDYPLIGGSGVKATYYRIGATGDFQLYAMPVTIPEGTTTVYFYSVDNNDNVEATKQASFTVDTKAPTVEIIEPKEGWLYLFGSPIMERIFGGGKTLCIGRVPIEATADDAGGSGILRVLFEMDGKTSWSDAAPYTTQFKGMKFGELTIKATAIDKVGLVSAPDEVTVTVYSIGLF